MVWQMFRTTLLWGLSVMALAACVGPRAAPPANIPMYHRTSSLGPQASAIGTLALDGECLILRGGGSSYLLAFPSPGTEWDSTTQSVSVDGTTARVGDTVTLGGGEAGSPPDEDWAVPPPADCQRPTRWLVTLIVSSES